MWSSPPGLFRLCPTLAPHRPRTCNMRDLLKISELGAEAPEVSPWLEHDVPQRVELLLADQDPEGLSELGALGLSEEIKHAVRTANAAVLAFPGRSEEHTSELQSLMRISYAVFCL